MTHSPEVTATALVAFLRGIERRAQVFALAQSGDADAGTRAVQATVRTFSEQAGDCPIGTWPAQFWTLLVQRPELARGSGEPPLLTSLSPGPRAALLLRLVAGLDFAHGAQVLAVAEPTYRFALQRGLDQLHAAGHDMAALEALRESLRARVLATHAATVGGMRSPAATPLTDSASETRGELPSRWSIVVLSTLLLAFALSFLPGVDAWLDSLFAEMADTMVKAPMSLDTESGIVTHPDFQLLVAPADEALADDLGFLAWYEAGSPFPDAVPTPANFAAAPAAIAASSVFADLPAPVRQTLASIASLWPQLDEAARSRLLENTERWQVLDSAQRDAMQARIRQWDALPPTTRARRRGSHARWQALIAPERAAIRAAARGFVALPFPAQQTLRARFAALPDETRDSWAQGPMLGRSLPELAPLFEFVPADERDALLAVVRVLSPELRTALAARIAPMPRAERERLRRKLIATPLGGHAAVIAGGKPQ